MSTSEIFTSRQRASTVARRGAAVVLCALVVGASADIATANVEALPGSGSTPGSAGLPDGRIYEQVSPANKNGNYVASAGGGGSNPVLAGRGYSAAASDGNALVFMGSGAMGEAASSLVQPYVSRRRSGLGWRTASVAPAPVAAAGVFGSANFLVMSSDFARFAFGSLRPYSSEQTLGPGEGSAEPSGSVNLYLTGSPFAAPTWIANPTIAETIPGPGNNASGNDFDLAGGSPTLDRVYFAYAGTLIAQDGSRAPHVGGVGSSRPTTSAWGFYEWSDHGLAPAGVLPDGSVSPFGAMPAALAGEQPLERAGLEHWEAGGFDGQVSADGSRVFFVSPDPVASSVTDPQGCEEAPDNCTSAPPELYVRESAADGSRRTILVSQSQLPGHLGELAPSGPVPVPSAIVFYGQLGSSDAYAASDGSRVFFASRDRLTVAAPEGTAVKEYEFDVKRGVLTYLPEVQGSIVAAAQDGSDFMFEDTAAGSAALELWQEAAGGGHVSAVTQLPTPPTTGEEDYGGLLGIEARASADGGVFVFDTNAPVPGGYNDGGGYSQVFRYDLQTNRLTCVSCPPAGVAPSGDANISYDNYSGSDGLMGSTKDTRAMSADGSRVFFDTPEALVANDSNGLRDVYEWEDGRVYLISSGSSDEPSFYLDNSESGGDVFFNTSEGLVTGDTDEAFDAYDARIPRPGDEPPPASVPCIGDVCQGSPSVPELLATPASAAFEGEGNMATVTSGAVKGKHKGRRRSKATAKAKRRAKRAPRPDSRRGRRVARNRLSGSRRRGGNR